MEPMCTNREVLANRSVTMIKNKKEKICTVIDVSVPSDRNVTHKEGKR
jgi:hypothetical protein